MSAPAAAASSSSSVSAAGLILRSAEEARAAGRAALDDYIKREDAELGYAGTVFTFNPDDLFAEYHDAYAKVRFGRKETYERALQAAKASPDNNREVLAAIADACVDFEEVMQVKLFTANEYPSLTPTPILHLGTTWTLHGLTYQATLALRLEVLRRVPLTWLRDIIEPAIRRESVSYSSLSFTHARENARLMAIVHTERLDTRGTLQRADVHGHLALTHGLGDQFTSQFLANVRGMLGERPRSGEPRLEELPQRPYAIREAQVARRRQQLLDLAARVDSMTKRQYVKAMSRLRREAKAEDEPPSQRPKPSAAAEEAADDDAPVPMTDILIEQQLASALKRADLKDRAPDARGGKRSKK